MVLKKLAKLANQFAPMLMPSMWIMIHKYSPAWDEALNRMLDKPVFENDDHYTVKLNGVHVWVQNYPFGYATPYGMGEQVRPRRSTILRFRKLHLQNKYKDLK